MHISRTRTTMRTIFSAWGVTVGLATSAAASNCDPNVALKGVYLAGADLWTRLAAEFKENTVTAFGLKNESARPPTAQWAEIAQTTVDA